jgi:hypothetical protein
MKSLILFTVFIQSCLTGFSQKDKVTVENDNVMINGEQAFVLERVGNAMSADTRLKTLEGKEVAFFKFCEFYDNAAINSGNPKGRVTYFEVTFMDSSLKCEVDFPVAKKQLGKAINDFGLIKNSQPDEKAIDNFVKIHGNKYSERRKTSTTIIINN